MAWLRTDEGAPPPPPQGVNTGCVCDRTCSAIIPVISQQDSRITINVRWRHILLSFLPAKTRHAPPAPAHADAASSALSSQETSLFNQFNRNLRNARGNVTSAFQCTVVPSCFSHIPHGFRGTDPCHVSPPAQYYAVTGSNDIQFTCLSGQTITTSLEPTNFVTGSSVTVTVPAHTPFPLPYRPPRAQHPAADTPMHPSSLVSGVSDASRPPFPKDSFVT